MSPAELRAMRTCAIAARRNELLSVQEFADLVRVHPRSVYRAILAGRQRGVVHLGRDLRIDIVVAFLPETARRPVG